MRIKSFITQLLLSEYFISDVVTFYVRDTFLNVELWKIELPSFQKYLKPFQNKYNLFLLNHPCKGKQNLIVILGMSIILMFAHNKIGFYQKFSRHVE